MRKRFCHAAMAVVLLIATMTAGGCSYKQMEDSARAEVQETLPGINVGEVRTDEDESDNIVEVQPGEVDTSDDNIHEKGETIVWTYYSGQKVSYSLVDVQTGYDLHDFGVAREECSELSQQLFIDENGIVLDGADGKNVFVAVDVRINNIDYEGFKDGSGIDYLIFVDNTLHSQTELLDPDIFYNMPLAYFSEHLNIEKSYNQFILEPGTEVEAKLIWIVPEVVLEEPVYYTIGSGSEREIWQLFWLNKEGA